jgi:hypothetical protein
LTRTEADIEELELLASARTELADLRQQLGHAIEQARAAEERSAKLQADLLAERQGIRELSESHAMGSTSDEALDEEPANPFPWMDANDNGNGNSPVDEQPTVEEPEAADEAGDAEDSEPPAADKSLRYRLAQSAARKKGLGELDLPS